MFTQDISCIEMNEEVYFCIVRRSIHLQKPQE